LQNSSWLFLSHLGISMVQLDCTKDAADVAKQLESEHAGDLEFVELDQRNLFKMQSPQIADPHWSRQWGFRRSGFESAWNRLESMQVEPAPVTIAVLDTGIQLDHEDLQGRLWQNEGEIPNNGVDDDGNGFVDDVHGYDFADEDGDPSDDDGHGTHCAGVIAAVRNAVGVVGAAGGNPAIRIMALRFLSRDGGRTSDAVLALNYAISMGAIVSSNSWGGPSHSLALQAAVQSAKEAGHLFVAAAGNLGRSNDLIPTYPCNYEPALCVAATAPTDQLADYSNYGVDSVQIAAPGAKPKISPNRLLNEARNEAKDDLQSIVVESAERAPWLDGFVSAGLLDVAAMVSKAESRNWIRLQEPSGGWRDPTGTLARISVPANGAVSLGVEIGHEFLGVGVYQAQINIDWGEGKEDCEEKVPVQYEILGTPFLPSTIFAGTLEFGTVPVGGEGRRTVRIWNFGNGTARAQVMPLAVPFAGPTMEVSVEPHQSADVVITCRPRSTGTYAGTVEFKTNSGLTAFDAVAVDALDRGEAFTMPLNCEGSEAPHMELDAFSGVMLLREGALPFHVSPSVPAEWESEIVDPQAPECNVTAFLAAASTANEQGCEPHEASLAGKIVIVARGGCTFQQKTEMIQARFSWGLFSGTNTSQNTTNNDTTESDSNASANANAKVSRNTCHVNPIVRLRRRLLNITVSVRIIGTRMKSNNETSK
ncbi:unnamed protein product, partial [Symbiodinium sp. CCMP2456]